MTIDKKNISTLVNDLRKIACEWDPIGVMDNPDWPSDEYDCVLGPLTTMLIQNKSIEEIDHFLKNELKHHFGIDPADENKHELLAVKAKAMYEEKWKSSF